MKHDLQIILGKVSRFLLYSLLLAGLMGLIFIDVHWLHNFVYETSLTEIAQELMLATISSCFSLLHVGNPLTDRRGCWSAGFSCAC